jgi:hypothetical protein
MRLTGTAKFAYLSLEAPEVDLGEVLLGQSRETVVRLGNHSPVAARFMVKHDDGPMDRVFLVTPAE